MNPIDNSEHLHKLQSNIGEITVIQTIRKNRPVGLKKPYEYVLPLLKVTKLFDTLKKTTKRFGNIQIAMVDKKTITRGIRLNLFFLGYFEDITEQGWNDATAEIQDILFKYLGPDAKMYIEPYNDVPFKMPPNIQNFQQLAKFQKSLPVLTPSKFQARFETYIAYKELL